MRIAKAVLADRAIRDLLTLHFEDMHASSPPGTAYVLDLAALDREDIELFGAWRDEMLCAVGALRNHPDFAEIKSMRAHPDARRTGAGRALLEYLIATARDAGHGKVKLETGTGQTFEAANALYRSVGFEPCGPFAGYRPSDFNRFYVLEL